jgi:hypothetical protein
MIKRGSKGRLVSELQLGLARLGYHPGQADGIYGGLTEQAVAEFQTKAHILSDGVFGPITREAFNASLKEAGIGELRVAMEQPKKSVHAVPDKLLRWVRCPADTVEGYAGYSRTTLREGGVADAYKQLHKEVKSLGGVITSAGGRRSLSSKASPSRSKCSMHYLGRAFDMSIYSGMVKPEKDPFIITKDTTDPRGRKWVVWCRTESMDVPPVSLDAVYVTRGKNAKGRKYTQIHTKPVTARAFNFTDLCAKHGFYNISARSSFFRGGSFGGAEWWHFQWEDGLIHGKTTFGQELLKVYPVEKCKEFVYWNVVKDFVFGEHWN